MSTADAKLAGNMYATPGYMFLWLPILYDAGCARQDRTSLFERGPPVLGNFELSTPNLVHRWNSMSVIRWCMSFRGGVHSARAARALCICIGTFAFGKLSARKLKLGALVHSAHATRVQYVSPLISGNFNLAMQKLGQ